jgi:hypothetical protein
MISGIKRKLAKCFKIQSNLKHELRSGTKPERCNLEVCQSSAGEEVARKPLLPLFWSTAVSLIKLTWNGGKVYFKYASQWSGSSDCTG